MIEISSYDNKTILTLTVSHDGNEYFSIEGKQTHFRVREFASKDGADTVKVCVGLVYLLEAIRQATGQPVTINSGYRTQDHNTKVGGAASSQHLFGKAADIVVGGKKTTAHALKIAALAEKLGATGIGLYKNFTHVDVRDNISRWDQTGLSLLYKGSFIY